MIGDIVALSIDLLKESCQPFVSRLNIKNIAAIDNGQLVAYPIPLTEEILKANGFVVNTQQAYLIDGIFLDKGLDGNAYWWQIGHCPICAINYVHELQHALRICGLNELADNFKLKEDKR